MKKIVAKNKEHLNQLIKEEMDKNGNICDLNHIDVSRVTNMSWVFYNISFNGDISEWDVSNVKHMTYMFCDSKFNGDISKWNVSNVENMSGMFSNSNFDGDISGWDVSHVKDMDGMFENCRASKPWWYIENHKKRKEEIRRRSGIIPLKEKIENKPKKISEINKNKLKL